MKSNGKYLKLLDKVLAVSHAAAREDTLVKLEVSHIESVLVAPKVEVSAGVVASAGDPTHHQFQSYYITALFSKYIV